MNLQEGPIVDYLGIKIDLNSDEGVYYAQIGLAENILDNEKVTGVSLTSAGPKLFHVSVTGKEAELLAEEDRKQLHSTVYALQHLALGQDLIYYCRLIFPRRGLRKQIKKREKESDENTQVP